MHTVKIIAAGFVLLAFCLLVGRYGAGASPATGMATAAKAFLALWLVAAGLNMWVACPEPATRWRRRHRCSRWCSPYRRRSPCWCGGGVPMPSHPV